MRLDRNRPEILTPPGHPPDCCQQQTITVPPEVNAKTAQKHDYPSRAHRRSYARRTGAERTFSTAKDPASNNIARGWTRLMGLAPIMLWLACLLAVRNQRILDRLGRPPGRRRPPRRGRPATQNPPPAPQDPHRPGHRRHPALTRPAPRTAPPGGTLTGPTQTPASQASHRCPENIPASTPQPANRPRRPAHAECQTQT